MLRRISGVVFAQMKKLKSPFHADVVRRKRTTKGLLTFMARVVDAARTKRRSPTNEKKFVEGIVSTIF